MSENGLTIVEQGTETATGLSLSDVTFNRNYLMLVSVTSEVLTFGIPYTLHILISIVMYLRGHLGRRYPHEEPGPELDIELPSAQLEVYFDDVEDTHYSRRFNVIFSPIFWAVAERKLAKDERDVVWSGEFEFKVIK